MNETRNHLLEEINHNDYLEHSLVLVSANSRCASISIFDSLVGDPVGIVSSSVGLKIMCALTAGSKKYKPIIKKIRQKFYNIVLLDTYINHE